MLGPIYGLLGAALWMCWDLNSVPGIVGVALMAMVLGLTTCTNFTRVKARGPGVDLDLFQEKNRRIRSARKNKTPKKPEALIGDGEVPATAARHERSSSWAAPL